MANNKYVITFKNGNITADAGSKAPSDVAYFLESNGFNRFDIYLMKQGTEQSRLFILKTVLKLAIGIKFNSLVIVQYPVYSKKGLIIIKCVRPFLKWFKKVKMVALIHDIRYLRKDPYPKEKEIAELNRYSSLIVHSQQMIDALKKDGCTANYSILGLFDYAVEHRNTINRCLSKEVCFAGNFESCPFLKDIHLVCENDIIFNLYGYPQFATSGNIRYCGQFNSSDVSSIKGSWGLVWGGGSINELQDLYNYYNIISPHKASLYVAAEMPLIVSEDSALARFVKEKGIGICIKYLRDIDSEISNVSQDLYNEMSLNIRDLSHSLNKGNNLINAIKSLH